MLVGEAEKKYHILRDYRNIAINGSLEQAKRYYKQYIKGEEDESKDRETEGDI